MSMVRTSSAAILRYHFDERNIRFALPASMLGFASGMTFVPVISEYLFKTFGFSSTMLIVVPFMGIHVLCGLVYVQPSTTDCNEKEASTGRQRAADVLIIIQNVLSNGKVFNRYYPVTNPGHSSTVVISN